MIVIIINIFADQMKYLSIFIVFALPCFCSAQNNFSSQNVKGDLNIANWQPASGENGASISSISLEYTYETDSTEPKEMFNFIWFIGDEVFVDGKKYKKEQIEENVFNNIKISSLSLKAKIYSNGKYEGEIIIDYTSVIPKSGRKSGWYVTGNHEWDNLFQNISAEKTKKIFDRGFELRQPQIYKIEFSGLDAIKKTSPENSETENSVTNGSEGQSGGNSTLHKSGNTKKRKNKPKIKLMMEDIRLDIQTGNISKYRGLSWHVNTNIGLGYQQFSINSVSYKQTIYDNNPFPVPDTLVTRKYCRTPTVRAGAEIWPVFGDHFGGGITGSFQYGWIPSFTKTADINFGGKIYGGAQPVKITLEYKYGFRFGEYKYDFQNEFDGGIVNVRRNAVADFSYQRIGFGSIAWIDTEKPLAIELIILFEKSDLSSDNQKQYSIFRIAVWMHNRFCFGAEASPEYRNAGEVNYKVIPQYKSSGMYFNIFFSKSLDFFGTKYFSSLRKGNL